MLRGYTCAVAASIVAVACYFLYRTRRHNGDVSNARLHENSSKQTTLSASPSDDTAGTWYFAYGSNMNATRFTTRVGSFVCRKLFYLQRHKLVFNKVVGLGSVANIQPTSSENDVVFGVGYLLSHVDQLNKMDVFEGVAGGHYSRTEVTCYDAATHRPVRCHVYIACPSATREGLLPTAEYMSHLIAGRDVLPEHYTSQLVAQPVRAL